jgi:Na+/melibiose symporter-like transporter
MKKSQASRGSRPLTQCEILSFAIGHIQNDMTASCWFSYLLVFLHTVPMLSPIDSAIVMFSGQLGDAIATPLVGLCSDLSTGIPSLKMVSADTFLFCAKLNCLV